MALAFPRARLLFAALAGVLVLVTGCSRHTALTVKADLVSFMSHDRTHATAPYGGGVDLQLPVASSSPNPGELVDLGQLGVPPGAIDGIGSLSLALAASLTPSTAIDSGTATFYLADANASNAFEPQYQVAQVATPALPAGAATPVSAGVQLDSQSHPDALQRVHSGSFRLGVEVRASAGTSGSLDVELTQLLVSASLPPGWGLP